MKISLTEYDPDWPAQFDLLSAQLRSVLIGDEIRIEHIGSTAVQGLKAKPVIDILVGLPEDAPLDDAAASVAEMPGWAYVAYWNERMPFRRFFIRFREEAPGDLWGRSMIGDSSVLSVPMELKACHCHMVHLWHPFFEAHLRFRDILRSDARARKEYAALKMDLAVKEWSSGAAYAEAKGEFIRRILASEGLA